MNDLGTSRRNGWRKIALAAVVLTAAAFGCTQVWDSDVGQHIASGDWMLRTGEIIGRSADPFSVDGPSRFVNVHWGFQILLSLLHGIGGFGALTLLKMAALAGTVAIVCAFLARGISPSWVMLCGLLLVLGLESRVRARPELLTFLLLAETLVILESTRQDGKSRRLWWLVPINILWVNTHGLFVLGAACLVMAVAGDWLDRLLRRPDAGKLAQRKAIPPALVAIVAIFIVSPWPLEAALHPLLLSTRIGGNSLYAFGVDEIQPTYLVNPFSNLPTAANLLLALAVLQLMLSRFWRVGLWHWLLLGFFATLGALATRNVAIFAIPGVLLLGRYAPAWLKNQLARRRPAAAAATPAAVRDSTTEKAAGVAPAQLRPAIFALRVLLLAACALLVGLCLSEHFYRWQGRTTRSGFGLQADAWPVRTARFLAASDLSGDILPMNFGDGGTFDLYAWPAHKTWMDGRLEVHSAQRFEWLHELRTRMLTKDSASDIEQTLLPPTVRFLFVGADDGRLLEALRLSDRFQLLYIEPAGVCFARKSMSGEKAEQLRQWEKAQPLPPANIDEYDRPVGPGERLYNTAGPRWYRCNEPPLNWRLGAMFFSLGLDDLAVRYLGAMTPGGNAPRLQRIGLLAQSHQRLAEAMAIEPDDALPVDINLSRALALYDGLDMNDLANEDAQALALMKVRALLFGRQIDAAWAAMQAYLGHLPIPLRWRPTTQAIALRDQIRQGLLLAQSKAQAFAKTELSSELHARLLLRKDVGLIDGAIGELERATTLDAPARQLLGELYLRKGQVSKARAALGKLAPSDDLTLRLALCDWASGDLPAAQENLKKVDTAAARFYLALLLEQSGHYEQAIAALGPLPATTPADPLRRQIVRLSAALASERSIQQRMPQ